MVFYNVKLRCQICWPVGSRSNFFFSCGLMQVLSKCHWIIAHRKKNKTHAHMQTISPLLPKFISTETIKWWWRWYAFADQLKCHKCKKTLATTWKWLWNRRNGKISNLSLIDYHRRKKKRNEQIVCQLCVSSPSHLTQCFGAPLTKI